MPPVGLASIIPMSSAMLVLERLIFRGADKKSAGCLKNALGRVYSRRPHSSELRNQRPDHTTPGPVCPPFYG